VTEQRIQRRLAAILAADVVGYSALLQRAEEATYAEFERLKRELIHPASPATKGDLSRLRVTARSSNSRVLWPP
jgi:adenylate cyclase